MLQKFKEGIIKKTNELKALIKKWINIGIENRSLENQLVIHTIECRIA